MKKRLKVVSSKLKTSIIQLVSNSGKLNKDLQVREVKPATINQQCLVYKFQYRLCNAGYVDYTRGHLLERDLMDENKNLRQ